VIPITPAADLTRCAELYSNCSFYLVQPSHEKCKTARNENIEQKTTKKVRLMMLMLKTDLKCSEWFSFFTKKKQLKTKQL